MPRFDLDLLASLDALLQERNVTAAARKMGVSQPTMSGRLNQLREQLQDQLLTRVGRSFELTPRARELAEDVRQALLAVDGLMKPRSSPELSQSSRHFRIMTSDFSMLLLLPKVFQLAAEVAPSMTFEIVPIYAAAEQVYGGYVDLCITGDGVEHVQGGAASVLRTLILAEYRLVGIVDQNHPLRGSITLDQFLAYPRVSTQFPGLSRVLEDYAVAGLSRSHPPRIKVPSFLGLGAYLPGTDMIATIPARLVPLLPECWPVRTVGLPSEFRNRMRLLWHSRFDREPAHQWLRQAIIDHVPPPGGDMEHG